MMEMMLYLGSLVGKHMEAGSCRQVRCLRRGMPHFDYVFEAWGWGKQVAPLGWIFVSEEIIEPILCNKDALEGICKDLAQRLDHVLQKL